METFHKKGNFYFSFMEKVFFTNFAQLSFDHILSIKFSGFIRLLLNVFLMLNIIRVVAEKFSISLCNNYQLIPASDVSRSDKV